MPAPVHERALTLCVDGCLYLAGSLARWIPGNRWRRRQLEGPLRDEIMPKNILMIGPTGVGKTGTYNAHRRHSQPMDASMLTCCSSSSRALSCSRSLTHNRGTTLPPVISPTGGSAIACSSRFQVIADSRCVWWALDCPTSREPLRSAVPQGRGHQVHRGRLPRSRCRSDPARSRRYWHPADQAQDAQEEREAGAFARAHSLIRRAPRAHSRCVNAAAVGVDVDAVGRTR